MTIEWTGLEEMKRHMDAYADKVLEAVHAVASYWQPVIESYAKDHANWTDRTGNARQSLHSFVQDVSNDAVELYLSHGRDYGIWLEVRWSGKYAIIWPTLSAHLPQIHAMLEGIFNG